MTNRQLKALSIGLAGAGALLLGAGQAVAGVCPFDTPVMTVTAAGFSCTLGDKTFSGFSISGAPSGAVVEFIQSGSLFVVSLSRDGTSFSPGTVTFDYDVTAAAPSTIVEGTVGIDVPTMTPPVVTGTHMNGLALLDSMGRSALQNSDTGTIIFSPGVSTIATVNTTVIPAGDFLTSVTNTYSQVKEGVPEPASLALFGLGLLGLGLTRRRRS